MHTWTMLLYSGVFFLCITHQLVDAYNWYNRHTRDPRTFLYKYKDGKYYNSAYHGYSNNWHPWKHYRHQRWRGWAEENDQFSVTDDFVQNKAKYDMVDMMTNMMLGIRSKIRAMDGMRQLHEKELSFQIGFGLGVARDTYKRMTQTFKMTLNRHKEIEAHDTLYFGILHIVEYFDMMELVAAYCVKIEGLVDAIRMVPIENVTDTEATSTVDYFHGQTRPDESDENGPPPPGQRPDDERRFLKDTLRTTKKYQHHFKNATTTKRYQRAWTGKVSWNTGVLY